MDVHMMISAFCFFRVANRGSLFDRDMLDPELRQMLDDIVLSHLTG